MNPRDLLSAPKLGYRAPEAADYLGLSESKFHDLIRQKRIPQGDLIDRCRVWRVDTLRDTYLRLTGSATGNPWKERLGKT
jgi:hypothetical protein